MDATVAVSIVMAGEVRVRSQGRGRGLDGMGRRQGRVVVVMIMVVGRRSAGPNPRGHVLVEVETRQGPMGQGRGGRSGPDVLEGQVHGCNGMKGA